MSWSRTGSPLLTLQSIRRGTISAVESPRIRERRLPPESAAGGFRVHASGPMLSVLAGRRRGSERSARLSAPACAHPACAQYTRRFTTIDNGAITFTGNALGLDGEPSQNGQGTRGSIATFITTDLTQRDTTPAPTTAPPFPPGT